MTDPPSDLDVLCADLGVGLKRRARLAQEHGDDLIPWLQKVWRWARAQDVVRIPAKQAGHLHPHQYTQSTVAGLNEEPEAVPPAEIEMYRESVQARIRFSQEKEAEIVDVKGAMLELKVTIDALPRDTKRSMGRSFWILQTRLNAALRDLKHREAA